VHDDGAGVSEGDRERIFARGTTLQTGGTLGLGLFVARGLARAHHGDVTVEDSALTGGACFTLRLPADCPPPPASD
ncbi:MAG: HAMP domain-containing sensor histidine kinase, partial [Nitriliruptorales bacterium]|nr:HAMP domain-containing sensor histidine kinase [Nitriliruptorales bacterium]